MFRPGPHRFGMAGEPDYGGDGVSDYSPRGRSSDSSFCFLVTLLPPAAPGLLLRHSVRPDDRARDRDYPSDGGGSAVPASWGLGSGTSVRGFSSGAKGVGFVIHCGSTRDCHSRFIAGDIGEYSDLFINWRKAGVTSSAPHLLYPTMFHKSYRCRGAPSPVNDLVC